MTNDIRLHDNQCWDYFVDHKGPKRVIAILDPKIADEKINKRFNKRAFTVFHTAIHQLFKVIKDLGYTTMTHNNYDIVKGSDVIMSEDTTPFAMQRLSVIKELAKNVITFDTKHLLPAPPKKYTVYSAYLKSVRSSVYTEKTVRGKTIVIWESIRKNTKGDPADIKLYSDAIKSLHNFNPDNYLRYSKASIKVHSGSTGVSWAIARGIVSAREVYEYVRKKCNDVEYLPAMESLFRELIFRDFYSRATLWYIKDYNDTFRNPKVHWKITSMQDYTHEIKHNSPEVIKMMYKELIDTGMLSNYGRMLFATWTYDIGANWRLGELLFAKYLLDYDFSSNRWNWAHHSVQGLNYQWPAKKFKISNVYLYV